MVITCPLDIPAIAYTGGGCADVYQTEYDGRPVAVKSIRIRGRSGQERCSSVGTPLLSHKRSSTDPATTEALSRSHYMEAPAAPKCSTIARRSAEHADT